MSLVDALPPRREGWTQGAADGCTVCHSQDCVTVDGHNGRRCSSHPPRFEPSRAVALMTAGFPGAALAYCRAEFGEAA